MEANDANLRYVQNHGVELFSELMGETKRDESVLFKDFYENALAFIGMYVSEETRKRRVANIKDAVLPHLGSRNMMNISPSDIEDWQQIIYTERGADYTSRLKSLLKRVFKRAVVKGIIASNPCDSTETIRKGKKQKRAIYTKEEVKAMIKEADDFLKAFIIVYATLGLRTSEMVGLKFDDIDFESKIIHIQRGIRHGRVAPPKTGERFVDIPDLAHSILLELKKRSSSPWVFANQKGEAYHDGSSINSNIFQPFLKKIGVEYKSMYSLRHFKATLALREGQDLAYLSKQIGHANIKTTLDYYIGHLENADNRKKANEIFDF
jgi:integrase